MGEVMTIGGLIVEAEEGVEDEEVTGINTYTLLVYHQMYFLYGFDSYF